jgi:hypothetical protein
MNAVTLPAHFDGRQIVLDEPYELQPNTALVVTILPEDNEERQDYLRLAQQSIAAAYGDDEPEYTLDDIKIWNPDYRGG